MSRRSEKSATRPSDSELLAQILAELKHIRSQLDLVLDSAPVSLEAIEPAPQDPVPQQPEVVEIVDAEILEEDEPADAPAPSTLSELVKAQSEAEPVKKTAGKSRRASSRKSAPSTKRKPAKTPKTKSPDTGARSESPATEQPAPPDAQSEEIPSFDLPKPASQEEQARLFVVQRRRVEDMMSLAQFTRAESLAQALLSSLPDWTEAEALLETVRRESKAFRSEQQARLFSEFQKWTESRQWINALSVGEQLLDKYPACNRAQHVSATMATVRSNAHFQEARQLRDRISDLIRRKRFAEAIKIAEDVVVRFPNTQVARQLRSLIPNMKRRSGEFH